MLVFHLRCCVDLHSEVRRAVYTNVIPETRLLRERAAKWCRMRFNCLSRTCLPSSHKFNQHPQRELPADVCVYHSSHVCPQRDGARSHVQTDKCTLCSRAGAQTRHNDSPVTTPVFKLLYITRVHRPRSAAVPRLIIDTDMSTDCDDVGATCIAHALMDRGEVDLIAVVHDTGTSQTH